MPLRLQFKPFSLPSLSSSSSIKHSQTLTIKPKPSMSSSSSSSSWSCTRCTFLNPPSQSLTCQICLSSSSSTGSHQSSSPPKWACRSCTYLNPYSTRVCRICDSRSSSLSVDQLGLDDDPVAAASVGSVFFPLRKCSVGAVSGSGDQRGVDEKRTEEVAAKRKIVEVVDDDGEELDGAFGFRGVKSVKRGSVSENSEANNDLVKAQENVDANQGLRTIKILTYNVWFREDLEMHRRMQAIGDLIEQHSPDIICMQEVTPDIYNIFQWSSWWKKYRCSISPAEFLGAYFCIQLAKLPVKSFIRRPFSYTGMGRELCIAELQLEGNKPLVVATSHLESPCPGPPTWDQMFSKERVAQAKESISFLNQHQNVIFCGDMNWDDKLDGPFPFPDGWADAWMDLRPGESGLTYDTKSNKMLSANRTLQKRLDRFICSLMDFKISGIEMIGTEAIPGLLYFKEKKTRKVIEKLELPVLPSDHFGLLLTITGK